MFNKRECVEEREGGDLQVRPTAYRHSRRNAYTARTVPPARCGSMSEVAQRKRRYLALLLGHTDGAALAAGRLGTLTTHAQAPCKSDEGWAGESTVVRKPSALRVQGCGSRARRQRFGWRRRRTVVTQATVGTDLLEALEVLAQLHVERVGDDLRELAVLHVLLPVQHPVRHLATRAIASKFGEISKFENAERRGRALIAWVIAKPPQLV